MAAVLILLVSGVTLAWAALLPVTCDAALTTTALVERLTLLTSAVTAALVAYGRLRAKQEHKAVIQRTEGRPRSRSRAGASRGGKR